jgi:hypothetical protein
MKHLHRFAAVASFAWLTSCGVTTNRVASTDPDGSIVQEIECRKDHPEKCSMRAEQLCRPMGSEPIVLRPLELFDDRWRLVVRCRRP